MKSIPRHELEELLVDYLYDELNPETRERFEASVAAHPDLEAEVRAHQRTRTMVSGVPVARVPQGVLDDIMRAARKVATAEPKPTFWERLGRFLMQPAVATAAVFLVVAGTSIFLDEKRPVTSRLDVLEDVQAQPSAQPSLVRVDGAEAGTAAPVAPIGEAAQLDLSEPTVAAAQPSPDAPEQAELAARLAAAEQPMPADGQQMLGAAAAKREREREFDSAAAESKAQEPDPAWQQPPVVAEKPRPAEIKAAPHDIKEPASTPRRQARATAGGKLAERKTKGRNNSKGKKAAAFRKRRASGGQQVKLVDAFDVRRGVPGEGARNAGARQTKDGGAGKRSVGGLSGAVHRPDGHRPQTVAPAPKVVATKKFAQAYRTQASDKRDAVPQARPAAPRGDSEQASQAEDDLDDRSERVVAKRVAPEHATAPQQAKAPQPLSGGTGAPGASSHPARLDDTKDTGPARVGKKLRDQLNKHITAGEFAKARAVLAKLMKVPGWKKAALAERKRLERAVAAQQVLETRLEEAERAGSDAAGQKAGEVQREELQRSDRSRDNNKRYNFKSKRKRYSGKRKPARAKTADTASQPAVDKPSEKAGNGAGKPVPADKAAAVPKPETVTTDKKATPETAGKKAAGKKKAADSAKTQKAKPTQADKAGKQAAEPAKALPAKD